MPQIIEITDFSAPELDVYADTSGNTAFESVMSRRMGFLLQRVQ